MWSKLSFGKKVAVFIAGGVLIHVIVISWLCFYTFSKGHLPSSFGKLFWSGMASAYQSPKDKAPQEIREATIALQKDPNDHAAYAKRAAAQALLENYQEAIADYTSAIKLAPKNIGYLKGRAEAHHSADSNFNAINDYSAALKIQPRNAEILQARGEIYESEDNSGAALQDYSKAIEINDKSRAPYTKRGELLQSIKRYDDAISDYEAAIKIPDEFDTIAYRMLVRIYVVKQKYSEALRVATLWSNEFASDPEPLELRASVHSLMKNSALSEKDKAKSIRMLTAEIEKDEDSPSDYRNRADLLMHYGQRDKALADYKKALSLYENESGLSLANSDDYWTTYIAEKIGDKKLLLKISQKEIDELEDKIRKEPKNFEAFHDRGKLLEKCGELVAAKNDFLKAYSLSPTNDDYESHIADIEIKLKEYSHPRKIYEVAYQKDPRDLAATAKLAQIFYETKKFDKCEQIAKHSIAVDFMDEESYYWLAKVQEASGDQAAAGINFAKAAILGFEPEETVRD